MKNKKEHERFEEMADLLETLMIEALGDDESCKDRLVIMKIEREGRLLQAKMYTYIEKIFELSKEKLGDSSKNLSEEKIQKLEKQLNYLEQINKLLDDLENV